MLFFAVGLYGKLKQLLFITVITFSTCSYAFDPFVIRDITVNGNVTVESDSIIKALDIKIGKVFSEDDIKKSINLIYKLGFFDNVNIEIVNDKVVINVSEKMIINSIIINGMVEVDVKKCLCSLERIGLSTGSFFDNIALKKSIDYIKNEYNLKSFYNVNIEYVIDKLTNGCVNIRINIKEPKISKIRSIKIIGNKELSEKDILNLFQSTPPGWLTWYTKSDNFLLEKINYDIENLISHYMNLGYIDFSIKNKQMTFSNENKVDIFIAIDEGNKYKVNDIKLLGELRGFDEKILNLIKIEKGDYFSLSKINKISDDIKEMLGSYGYAFVQVSPSTKIERDIQFCDVLFNIDLGKKTYVNCINIVGNYRTDDCVIRREMRQLESSLYNYKDIKLSKNRLDKLGFFDNVDFILKKIDNHEDMVDIEVNILDKHTGIANIGLGYGSSESAIISANISEENIFGSGNDLSLELNTSKVAKNISISYHNPFFTKDGVSSIFSSYYKVNNPVDNGGNYKIKAMGSGVNFGFPISEDDNIFLGCSLERNKIFLYKDVKSSIYHRFVSEYGNNTNSFLINFGWSKDKRNNMFSPTYGSYTKISSDFSTKDLQYFNFSVHHQNYVPLNDKYILAINGMIDYGFSYGKKTYPAIKNVYAGGIGTIRGYVGSSVGPRDALTDEYLGGPIRVIFNTQIYLPFPGISNEKTLKWFVFGDIGKVFHESKINFYSNRNKYDNLIDNCGWRCSSGIGLSWQSPLGLMQLSYGIPLNKSEKDKIQRLQFQIGTAF